MATFCNPFRRLFSKSERDLASERKNRGSRQRQRTADEPQRAHQQSTIFPNAKRGGVSISSSTENSETTPWPAAQTIAPRGSQVTPASKPNAPLSRTTAAWDTLDSWLRPDDPDAQFWWRETGPALAVMMEEAQYSAFQQIDGLLFHLRFVVSRLGPKRAAIGASPDHWRSLMTDDFSPLEYSWKWDEAGEHPMIRYAIEPIGPQSGSAGDLVNQAATKDLIAHLDRERPGTNWEWFDKCLANFQSFEKPVQSARPSREVRAHSDETSLMMAFELSSGVIGTKAYFVPVKAEQTGIPRIDVLTDGVRELESASLRFPAFSSLSHFLSLGHQVDTTEVIGLAVDCVAPSESRLKLYLRSFGTSFDSVVHMLTLGGTLDHLSARALEELRTLWWALLGLDNDLSTSQDLAPVEKWSAGVLYHYDIKVGNAVPDAKVYIPVRHYGRSDEAVAAGLTSYLRRCDRATHATAYLRMLDRLCTYRSQADSCGLQTYVSVAFKGDRLVLTSYLSPEIYHPGRA